MDADAEVYRCGHPHSRGDPPPAQAEPPTSPGAAQDPAGILDRLPEVLKVREAATVLRIGRNQLYEAVARRELRAIRIGRSIRIPKQALLDLLARGSPWMASGDE